MFLILCPRLELVPLRNMVAMKKVSVEYVDILDVTLSKSFKQDALTKRTKRDYLLRQV